jgi:hypothetical protein
MKGELKEILEYFEGLVGKIPELKSFLYGGVELGMNRIYGEEGLSYPLLWTEQPDISVKHNGLNQWYLEYDIGLCIMDTAEQTHSAELQATKSLHAVALKLMKQINKDFKNQEIMDMKRGYSLAEVDKGWALNHVGWRLGFSFRFAANTLVGA